MKLHCPVRAFCFTFLSPLISQVNSSPMLWIFSYTNFPLVVRPRQSAHPLSGVCRSSGVRNSAVSLLQTMTTEFPGSLIVEVARLTLITFDPGARTSYMPSKFFFDLRFPRIFGPTSVVPRALRRNGTTEGRAEESGFAICTFLLPFVGLFCSFCHSFVDLDVTSIAVFPFVVGQEGLRSNCVFI